MDQLKLAIGRRPDWEEGADEPDEVQIFINGKELRATAREAELPFAKAEGHEEIAGNYVGLSPRWLQLNPHLFHGESRNFYTGPRKQVVLQCECGEEGCWPLLVRIRVEDDRVTWSEFEQPHRKKVGGQERTVEWDLSNIPMYCFDRKEYDREVGRFMGSIPDDLKSRFRQMSQGSNGNAEVSFNLDNRT